MVLRILNECEALMSNAFEIPHVAFLDVLHAPMKSTGRRRVTGGVLSQQLVSLSSTEVPDRALSVSIS